MFASFRMPPTGFGPGSQPGPEDGAELSWMPLPSGMRTYEPHLPEIADPAAAAPALALLAAVADACREAGAGGAGAVFPLDGLDGPNRRLLVETLGEGEVSARVAGGPAVLAQESVFAGVWLVRAGGAERIEVAPVPCDVSARAFAPVRPAAGPLAPRGAGVVNAPALVAELAERSRAFRPGAPAHVVNLSLLPHTPEDLAHLDAALGQGSAVLLSRGYGNCRVTATALPHLWRVQFFNSMDALILDSFEVTAVPEAVLAAAEDFADSAARLAEVLEAVS